MPTYFFHLRNGSDELLDLEGIDFPNMASAASCAVQQARSVMSHEVVSGQLDLSARIDVENKLGMILHSVAFTDALKITSSTR